MDKRIAVLEDDSSLVYLRNPIAVAKYKLSQIQQKVFIEIALMAKKSPDSIYYKLYIRDFQRKTGSASNDTTAIKLQIKEMAHIPILIEKTKTGGVVDATIFASVERFEDDPREYVEIEISQKVKPYFIEFADGEYFKYEIRNTRKLKSVYSIRLYLFLKSWKRVGKIVVGYQELRNIAGVGDNEYKLFGDFHKRVIKAALDELKDKTDLSFDYTLERERTKSQNSPVKNIHFKIYDNGLKAIEAEDAQDVTPLAIEPDSELLGLAAKIEPVSGPDLEALVTLYTRDRVMDVILLAIEEHTKGNKIRSLIPYLHKALKNNSAVGKGKKQQQVKAKQGEDKKRIQAHKAIEKQLATGFSEFKSNYLLQLGAEAPQPVKDAFWIQLQEEIKASPGLKKVYYDKSGNVQPDQIRIALGMQLNTRTDQELSIAYMQSIGKPAEVIDGRWRYVARDE